MTTIYLIRHAQAQGNLSGTVQGSSDLPLTELGQRQLEYLARRCRTLPLQKIYVSPLRRAYDTALAVNRHLNVPMEVEPALAEMHFGDWEGVTFEEMERRWPEERRIWREEPWRFAAPNGETMEQVYARASAVLKRAAAENRGGCAALVCHGCVMRNLYAFVRGGLEHYGDWKDWMNNVSLSRVEEENGRFVLRSKNEIEWLPEALRSM